ncbi:MAG: elongation factor P maturation arginine rhamnosyltransferase EarP [Pseudomonadales bacterium]|nr:elongation factor P maturation arginine rhamnosyltransferase EarP [Pseudomonadales bacterium]
MRIALFCKVIDNLGDAGVCWRLARQLIQAGASCTLLINELSTLAQLAPSLQFQPVQDLDGLCIIHWTNDTQAFAMLEQDAWIGCFACDWHPLLWKALAQQERPPRLYNLEYLGMESWVEGCHGKDSIHPTTGLRQTFWIPGFSPASGGLLREAGLLDRHEQWRQTPPQLPGLVNWPNADRILSLFCYAQAPLAGLIQALSENTLYSYLLVFPGPGLQAVSRVLNQPLSPHELIHQGSLSIHCLPLLNHTDYDLVLGACDLNLVRGEDSLLRAHWAGRPLLWQAYPQDQLAHCDKVTAWLNLRPISPAFIKLHQRYNQGTAQTEDFLAALASLDEETHLIRQFRAQLAQQSDLCYRLLANLQTTVALI